MSGILRQAVVRLCSLFFLALWLATPVRAADFMVEAGSGPDVAAALSGAQPGDRVILAAGDYGALHLRGLSFDPPVTLMAAPGGGGEARLTALHLQDVQGLHVEGLHVEGGDGGRALVTLAPGTRNIELRGLTIRSGPDHTSWKAEDWVEWAKIGIFAVGSDIRVRENRLTAVSHGIVMRGPRSYVIGNLVDGFSGDGMRGLGDDSLFEGNLVQNCVSVSGNHDDGFQSWSQGPDGKSGKGVVRNVVLRNNTIRNHTGERGPLTCNLQGIGMFDGMYENWLIEGNTVEIDAWHGITVAGGINVKVIGNTVRDLTPGRPGPAWIGIVAHKDGRPGKNNLIADNQATAYRTRGSNRSRNIDPRVTVMRDNKKLAPAR